MTEAPPAEATPPAAGATVCANCGRTRSDRFCPGCGQNDRDYIRSLPPLLGDILKETFELNSRIANTLKPMFLKPGELACEFSRNRRASYIPPIRLYLFASILFFFLLPVVANFGPPAEARLSAPHSHRELAELKKASESVDIEAFKTLLPPVQQRKVDRILAREGFFAPKAFLYAVAESSIAAELDAEQYGGVYVAASGSERDDLGSAWNRYLMARAVDALEDLKAGISLLIDNLPFAMFVTLPAYALLLMLFFRSSRRFYTEHLVFAVHLHSFAFIVFTILMAVPDGREPPGGDTAGPSATADAALAATAQDAEASGDAEVPLGEEPPPRVPADEQERTEDGWIEDTLEWIWLLLLLWVPAYHYLALRRYYRNGRLKTACKWAMLSFAYGVLLIPGFLLSVLITVLQL